MSKQDDAREALQATADYLFKVPHASGRLLFVAGAIREYLAGDSPTMDQALGLCLGRGRYERAANQANVEMISNFILEIMDGEPKPFKTVAELNGKSEKEFGRLLNLYKAQAMDKIVKKHISLLDLLDDEKA